MTYFYDQEVRILNSFGRKGFRCVDSIKNGEDYIIQTPSKKILSESDMEKILTSLKFGNKEQIEALQALEFLRSIRKYENRFKSHSL